MPSRLERLHALENRYNGPIPGSERDAVLYVAPPARRAALNRVRAHRRWAIQAIEASTKWRAIAARGGYAHLDSYSVLRYRVALSCNLTHAASQLIAWQAYALAMGYRSHSGRREFES
jgi:hypothetical protein